MGKKTFLTVAGIFMAAILLVSYFTDLHNIEQKRKKDAQKSDLPEGEAEGVKPVDPETGLVIGPGFNLVKANCLGCHSSKLITQNRASRTTWKETILWMQQTQNLWDLGENEPKILDYLSEHYAPGQAGRRLPLQQVEWYELGELDESYE